MTMTDTRQGTLAEAKRRVRVGTKLTLLECPWMPWAEGQVREVTRVQTKEFALRLVKQDGSVVESWVDWGKASVFQFNPGTNTFSIPRFGEADQPRAIYKIEV